MEPRREQSRAQHMGKAGRILNPNVFDSLRVMTMIPPMMSPWMTPAQGNLMLRPQQVPTKLIPGCAVTSHPRGCAVSTLHRKVPSHSLGIALFAWWSTSAARSPAQLVDTSLFLLTNQVRSNDNQTAERRYSRSA